MMTAANQNTNLGGVQLRFYELVQRGANCDDMRVFNLDRVHTTVKGTSESKHSVWEALA